MNIHDIHGYNQNLNIHPYPRQACQFIVTTAPAVLPWEWDGNRDHIYSMGISIVNPVGISMGILWEIIWKSYGNSCGNSYGILWEIPQVSCGNGMGITISFPRQPCTTVRVAYCEHSLIMNKIFGPKGVHTKRP